MKLKIYIQVCLCLGFIMINISQPVWCAYFGKNKLQTRELKWYIFETDHFEIHYYPEEEALAREVCELAEAAYRHDTRLLREKPHTKTPLFIYRNQVDFQQTNISPHIIGVGTGGFTEAFKSRIALPAPDSREQLREVIFHEFIHVLQFNILYGEGLRSFRVYKGYLIPLWIIEGLAEYGAQDWDSYADMVVRDAVLHDRLIPLTLMEGFNHLEDVYLAYKESQLAVQYLAERFGEDKLAAIFKKFKSQISLSQILRETIGIGLREFNQDFLYWVKEKYWVQAYKREAPRDFATPLDPAPSGRPTVSSGACWSPDERYLAYISNRDQIMRVYLKPWGRVAYAYPLTSRQFENFSLRGRPLTWSPDSRQLAFIAREEGKDYLYFLTISNRKLEKVDLPVDTFFSPAWSPDGRQIAIAGVQNGVSNIYLYSIANNKLIQITDDRYADDTPAWSPDGSTIVYSSERDHYWQLVWKSMQKIDQQPVPLTTYSSQHKSPIFSADGNFLYYSSDRNGIYNLFRLDLSTSEALQLTDIRSAAFQPAISPDGKKMTFTVYQNGNHELYLMSIRPQVEKAENTVSEAYSEVASENSINIIEQNQLAEKADINTDKEVLLKTESTVEKKKRNVIRDARPYQFRFSPDLLFLLAGYDSSQGIVGGGYITASDYLGNHLVSFVSDFVPGYQARTQLTYANLTYPIDILITASYRRNYYRIIDLETSTLLDQFNDEEIGGAIGLVEPFSLFDRIETEFALRYLKREHEDYIQQRRLTSLRLSLIHDSTTWFDFGPSNGFRHNLTLIWADKILGGEENYNLIQLNTQAYKSIDFINPGLVFGTRFMAAASMGPEHPVFLFGGIGLLPESGTLRGYRFGELLGSQLAVMNFEFRFPLARNINYSLWPLDFLLLKTIQMVLYDDIGIVSNNFAEITTEDIRNSVGLGIRLHTFLLGKELLTIRFDISQRTDKTAETVYVWGIGQAF